MNKLYIFFIALYPILSAYSISFYNGLDVGSALLLFLVPFLFLFGKKTSNKSFPKYYFAFLIFVLIDSIFILGNIPLRIILYSIILYAGCKFVDKDYLISAYKLICRFSIIFFLIQLGLSVIGIKISGIVSFLPTIYDGIDMVANQKENSRFSSFFLEPSYFAQFLMPYVCLHLFDESSKKNISKAIIVSIIMLITRSGNGIIMLMIIWGVWFFRSSLSKITKIGVMFAICCVACVLFYTTDIFTYFIERSRELSLEEGSDARFKSSGFLRLFNGYFFYSELPTINQIIGINPDYFSNSSFYDGSFLNGVTTILIMNGIIGLILFCPHIFYLYKKTDMRGRAIVLCSCFLMFSESLYLSPRMLFYIIVLIVLSREKLSEIVHIRNSIKLRPINNYE